MTPFTPDHERFRQTVRKFVENELLPHQREWEQAKDYPRDLYNKMGALGFLGITYPEKLGGSGLDYWYSVAFIEELVRSRMSGLNMDIMVQTEIATPIISILGTDEQKQEFVVPAIKGEKIGALGITEPGTGSDVANIATTAKRDGDDYIINGSKMFITNGGRADFITLAVRTGSEGHKGISLVTFPTDTKGFNVEKNLEKLGMHSSNTTLLHFDDCRMPKRYLLGEENHGFYYIMKNFQGERLGAAVSCCAESKQMIADAVQYGREREAFGKPIITNQYWRQKFAQRLSELEAAKQLTYHAAELFNQKQDAVREISMAKLLASELANTIAYDCLQFHGGAGYMEEYDIARAYRDVRLIPIGAGSSEIMREIIAKLEGF
jgi:citronellyl-CoA dehydrogenase